MKKMLTGLQPTGVITLGNYIGSIMQMKDLQDEYDSYIFIADLHSITIAQEAEELRKSLEHYKTIESTLQNTLIMAQSTAEEVKSVAKQKADQIINDAKVASQKECDSIQNQIVLKRKELEDLQKQFDIYKAKMESLLISQLELIKEINKNDEAV